MTATKCKYWMVKLKNYKLKPATHLANLISSENRLRFPPPIIADTLVIFLPIAGMCQFRIVVVIKLPNLTG